MNNPNPFVPQGSLLEQEKRRSRMKLAVFCVLAISVCGLTAMLIQGCKRETDSTDNTPTADQTNTPSFTDTNSSTTDASNTTAIVPPIPTNQPVVVPAPAPEPATTEYTVVAHDTLGKIAKKNGVTLEALEDANPGVVPTKLKVNQKLVIPAATADNSATAAATTTSTDTGEAIYKVKSGDTLTKIAKANGTTVKLIESENNLTTTKIKVGQKLKIPANAEAAVAAPVTAPVVPAPVTPALVPSATPAH
jgi:LysM repeat protein